MIRPFRWGVCLLPLLTLGLFLSTGCSTYRRVTATIIKVPPSPAVAASSGVQTDDILRITKALERTELAAIKAEAASDKARQASDKAKVAAEKAELAAIKAEAVFFKKQLK